MSRLLVFTVPDGVEPADLEHFARRAIDLGTGYEVMPVERTYSVHQADAVMVTRADAEWAELRARQSDHAGVVQRLQDALGMAR